MIAKILNGSIDTDQYTTFLKAHTAQFQNSKLNSDFELLKTAKQILRSHNNEFFMSLVQHQSDTLLNFMGHIFAQFYNDSPNLQSTKIFLEQS